jgi:hypothetical protein
MRPTGNELLAFEVSLHPRPPAADGGGSLTDERGCWPILAVPRESLGRPLAVGFDEALARLAALPRLYAEPDGSFVWASPAADRPWQVDGNLFERQGRVLLADLKGSCPAEALDRLLAAFGWPAEPLMFELVRAGVFVDEATFRRHAEARGAAGDGQTLRPR